MKKSGFKKFHRRHYRTSPITTGNEVDRNPDMHIDQDFPGYPHNPSKIELINPQTKTEKKTAALTSAKER